MPGRVFCLAVGSNLNRDQITRRCPSARTVSRVVLADFELYVTSHSDYWGGGGFSVRCCPGSELSGVVYEMDDKELDALTALEVSEGLEPLRLMVLLEDGAGVEAIAYAAPSGAQATLPSRKYMRVVLEGARSHALPAAYVEMLERWPTVD